MSKKNKIPSFIWIAKSSIANNSSFRVKFACNFYGRKWFSIEFKLHNQLTKCYFVIFHDNRIGVCLFIWFAYFFPCWFHPQITQIVAEKRKQMKKTSFKYDTRYIFLFCSFVRFFLFDCVTRSISNRTISLGFVCVFCVPTAIPNACRSTCNCVSICIVTRLYSCECEWRERDRRPFDMFRCIAHTVLHWHILRSRKIGPSLRQWSIIGEISWIKPWLDCNFALIPRTFNERKHFYFYGRSVSAQCFAYFWTFLFKFLPSKHLSTHTYARIFEHVVISPPVYFAYDIIKCRCWYRSVKWIDDTITENR